MANKAELIEKVAASADLTKKDATAAVEAVFETIKDTLADGEDLCYLNVSLTDKDGNPVPTDNRLITVKVSGEGSFKAIANGDPTCLESFQQPQMHLFSGQLTVLIQSSETPGEITVEVSGKGVRKATLKLQTK